MVDSRELYTLIVGQLLKDGYGEEAAAISARVFAGAEHAPSGRLGVLVELGGKAEERQRAVEAVAGAADGVAEPEGLDLETLDLSAPTPDVTPAVLKFTSLPTTSVAISADDSYVATGDTDGVVRVYAVQQALAGSLGATRLFTEHAGAINGLAFHPNGKHLFSCSKDRTIRMFDFTSVGAAPTFRKSIQESHNVRTIAIHPSGHFLLAGGDHPVIRVYDLRDLSCYASQNGLEQHTAPLTQLQWSRDARVYASACKGGDVKLWDGVSNRCTLTLERAHDGMAVASLQFSRNGKYLLSGGRDSVCRLWDTQSGGLLQKYVGATQMSRRLITCFGLSEKFVYACDESKGGVTGWETCKKAMLGVVGGIGTPRWIVHANKAPLLVTGGEDCTLRIWSTAGPTEGAAGEERPGAQ